VTTFFQRLFRKNKRQLDVPPNDNQGDQSATLGSGEKEGIQLDSPQLTAGFAQSVGKQRDHNEDAIFTLTTALVSDTRQIPFGLYIIADGMGGHQHGEVASAIAIRAMAGHVIRELYLTLFNLIDRPPRYSLQETMEKGVEEANEAILKKDLGGGTTLTAALILGERMTIAHVGDSRAYLIEMNRNIEVLTRDHSFVSRLVELGQITQQEAAVHPQRNVLYRALGQGEPFVPDIITAPLSNPGYLLLCSDGLWGVVEQEEILDIIFSTPTPEQACQKLIQVANTAGGPDNISAILVRIP
jgi:serine/threonine protein phosphatase PrpC